MLQIDIGTQDNIVFLNIVGDLVASTAPELKNKVTELIQKKFTHIIIEMDKVNFMDSTGLGACISCHKILKAQKGKLVLTGAQRGIEKVFQLTKAYKMINITPSRLEALKIIHESGEK